MVNSSDEADAKRERSGRWRGIVVTAIVVWLVGAALSTWGLMQARTWALRELPSPEAAAAWSEWREAASKPTAGVERRPPKSSEPPLLVLLRDHFPALLAGALVPLTFLVGFAGYVAGRARSTSKATPRY